MTSSKPANAKGAGSAPAASRAALPKPGPGNSDEAKAAVVASAADRPVAGSRIPANSLRVASRVVAKVVAVRPRAAKGPKGAAGSEADSIHPGC